MSVGQLSGYGFTLSGVGLDCKFFWCLDLGIAGAACCMRDRRSYAEMEAYACSVCGLVPVRGFSFPLCPGGLDVSACLACAGRAASAFCLWSCSYRLMFFDDKLQKNLCRLRDFIFQSKTQAKIDAAFSPDGGCMRGADGGFRGDRLRSCHANVSSDHGGRCKPISG